MTIAISIAGAITVAVTVRLMYLLFLGGKRIQEATAVGRFVGVLRPAVLKFAQGWSEQSWRYRLTAYPCMILTVAGVSALMYWLMPVMQTSPGVWDVVKYCLLIFLVGVAACVVVAFALIFGVYFLRESIGQWWERRKGGKEKAAAPGGPAAEIPNGEAGAKGEEPPATSGSGEANEAKAAAKENER